MAYSDFDKLKAFFFALSKSGYHPERLDPKIITPRDQIRVLDLIRDKNPLFRDKSNKEMYNFLRDPKEVNRILANFTPKESAELQKSLEGKLISTQETDIQLTGQVASPGQEIPPAGAAGSSSGVGPFSMPSIPSVSFTPRSRIAVRNTPPVRETPKIEIANKGGVVAEKPPSEFHVADKSGNITATYSREPVPAKGLAQEAPQPKLVVANKSGVVAEAPPSKIFVANSSGGVAREQSIHPPSRFSAFRSKAGRGIAGAARAGLERANPFLKKAGTGLVNGLTSIANPGGIGGMGGRSVFGRLGGIGRGGPGGFSVGRATKGRGGLIFALSLIGFMLLVGVLAVGGAPSSGEAAPLPSGTADISSCKFTRGAETPPDANFKSASLLSYIQEAAQKANIPPVVLAAFIRVESPATANMSNDEIANYSAGCVAGKTGESPTGALGIMQIQPPGTKSLKGDPASCDDCIDAGAKLVGKTVSSMTRVDYCDPRTSIIVGAGWILKKMSKLGYGDGTKWDPAWTNDRKAIEALVNTYYGGVLYPDYNTGPYNYADDVSNSIKNCRVSPGVIPPPSAGDLRQAIIDKFHIDLDASLDQQHLLWAWQILAIAEANAPKFFSLLQEKYPKITVIVWGGMGQRIGDTIYLSNAPGTFFAAGGEKEFQQILIHELGHIIHGERTDVKYTAQIENAKAADKDFLTGYAQGATANPIVVCARADSGEREVQLDEDFAEAVAYYINKDTLELNYSNKCPPKNPSQNPFRTGKYPNHLNLMKEVLGGNF